MKIKTKRQLTLPQLIEWAKENEIKDRMFLSGCYCVGFDRHGYIYFNSSVTIPLDRTFTVEVEEEITEDTKLSKLLAIFEHSENLYSEIHDNKNINDILNLDIKVKKSSTKTIHMVNDDGTHTLIWTHEKGLVE